MRHRFGAWLIVVALAATGGALPRAAAEDIPRFQVDPFWPKPLPDSWIVGQVAGVAVDKNDHVWIIHRPNTLLDDEKEAQQASRAHVRVFHLDGAEQSLLGLQVVGRPTGGGCLSLAHQHRSLRRMPIHIGPRVSVR